MPNPVHGEGPVPSNILFIGEAPGGEEEAQGRPFVGPSGQQFDDWLRVAGIDRYACRVTNTFSFRPPNNDIDKFITWKKKDGEARKWVHRNGAWVRPDLIRDLERLTAEVCATEPNLIVTLGRTPLWAILGVVPRIGDMRGNLFDVAVGGRRCKLLPTYHPAYVLRSWTDRGTAIHDIRRASREQHTRELTPRKENFIVRPSFQAVASWCDEIGRRLATSDCVKLSVDIETRGAWIACVGIATSAVDAICIPLMCVERRAGYWSEEEEAVLVKRLRAILNHPSAYIIGANFLYDAQYFSREWLFTPRVSADVQLKHHTLWSPLRKALGFLVTMYSEQPRYWKADGRTWDRSMPEETLWVYNCRDTTYTFEVNETLDQILNQSPGQLQASREFHENWLPVLDMIERGLRVNPILRSQYSHSLKEVEDAQRAYIERLVGHPLNPNSHHQLKRFFYEDLQIKPVVKRDADGSHETVDDEALDRISLREPLVSPIVRAIKDIRRAGKLRSTFVDVDLDADARMRYSINLTGAKSFRFSSSTSAFDTGTNAQTIPRSSSRVVYFLKEHGPTYVTELVGKHGFKQMDLDHAEDEEEIIVGDDGKARYRFAGPPIRNMFIPDDGYIIVDMDLERADLQVDAWESGDEKLKAMLRAGVDIHEENAKVVRMDRQTAKVFIHATHKGAKPRTVAAHCGISIFEAEIGQRRWFAEHPGIRDFHRRVEAISDSRTPVLYNPFGQRFPLLDRTYENVKEGVAWVAQSVVVTVINRAMRNFFAIPDLQLLLQVHDSLVFQVPEAWLPERVPFLREKASIVVPYPDPLVIPVGFKWSNKSWGECK